MNIILIPDLEDNKSYCLFSIKKIYISKNEILLQPLLTKDIYDLDSNNDIDNNNSNERDNYKEYQSNIFFSDNFFITRINSANLGIDLQRTLSENIQESNKKPNLIIETFNNLKAMFNNNNSNKQKLKSRKQTSIKNLITLIDTIYRNYQIKNEENLTNIKKIFQFLKKINGESFEKHINDNCTEYRNMTLKNNLMIYTKIYHYVHKTYKIKEVDSQMIPNLLEIISENQKILKEENYYFDESYTDKYNHLLNLKMNFLEYLSNVIIKLDFYESFRQNLKRYDNIGSNMYSYNSIWINEIYKFLNKNFDLLIKKRNLELDFIKEKLEVTLQNLKLLEILKTQIFVRLYSKELDPKTNIEKGLECKMINIVKNSYYDNFFVKLLIQYKQENLFSENILLLNYLNRKFFYYLKIYLKRIELRRKDYDEDIEIGSYDISTPNDKFYEVQDYSKLVYILIKIEQGLLTVSYRVDYNEIPDEILKREEDIKDMTYDKLLKFYDEEFNKYQDYYKGSNLIFNVKDFNMVSK
jgi:hypothetical protein